MIPGKLRADFGILYSCQPYERNWLGQPASSTKNSKLARKSEWQCFHCSHQEQAASYNIVVAVPYRRNFLRCE